MDQDSREVPTTARWLAWFTAVLLAVAGVSASVVEARQGRSADAFVSAAGGVNSTVDVPTSSSSTTLVRPASPSTSSTVPRSTTVPKAAAAVLAAIGSTTTVPLTTVPPTTQPPAPTTTTRPPTTTTAPTTTSTSSTSTTSTTIPARATVTVVNSHPGAIVVTLNGTEGSVPAGQQADVTVAVRATDTIEVRVAADAACKVTDSGTFFQRDGRYTMTVVAGQNACAGGPAPEFTLAAKP